MIAGGIIGAIVGTIVWLIMSSKASARSSYEALGPNPEVREVIDSLLPPQQIFQKLQGSATYRFEADSTPDAILLRRNPDMGAMGYAFLLRVAPNGTGSRISISCAPLSPSTKKVMPQHYKHFQAFLAKALG